MRTLSALFRHCWLVIPIYTLIIWSSCKKGAPATPANALFTALSEQQTGIRFNNVNVENENINILTYEYLYNGGGVAVGDVNNDGLTDVYFVANNVACQLYLNKGNFQFEDITEKSGASAKKGWKTGATMADVNGDGWLDIYVCRSADGNPENRRNLLFINNKDLTFTERAAEYGVDDDSYTTQAVFFDMDKDGDLDLFTLNHSLISISNKVGINPLLRNAREPYLSNRMWRNDQGKFTDVSDEAGIAGGISNYGLGVLAADLNRDGWTDLYVTNDYAEHDHLYLNNPARPGHFTDVVKTATGHVPHFSMGTDAADINRDGLPDIFAGDMLPEDNQRQKLLYGPHEWDKFQIMLRNELHYQYMRNMLQLNNGDGTFSEIGQLAGVSNTDWSWAILFADYDNDGWNDLFITNGYKRDFTNNDFLKYREDVENRLSMGQRPEGGLLEVIKKMPSNKVHNYAFRNRGDLTFENVSTAWGFERPILSQGAAYADLDNDGDLDLVVNNMDEPAGIFRNNTEKVTPAHRFVRFSLQGKAPNTHAIGGKVRLYRGAYIDERELQPVRGFQSSVEFALHFGLGASETIDSAVVIWPSGAYQRLTTVPTNQTIALQETQATGRWLEPKPTAPIFKVLSASPVAFTHEEEHFEDFSQQSTLPCFQSRQGPRAAQGDVNGDGLLDVFLPGAAGQAGQLWVQSAAGKFTALPSPAFVADQAQEGVEATFADVEGDGDLDLLVANGGYRFADNAPEYAPRLYLNDGKGHFAAKSDAFPQISINAATLCTADVDKDGDVDVFIGAQGKPNNYPLPAPSLLLLNDGKGTFQSANILPDGGQPGMVAKALWQDLNTDGWPDLVLAGPYMPLRAWINQGGKSFADESAARFPQNSTGWWSTLAQVDVNSDGDMDLVAGNWGLNNQIKASSTRPAALVYKDFDQNGTLDPLLGYTIQDKMYPALSLDELVFQLPMLRKKYLKYETYANVTFEALLTDKLQGGTRLPLDHFETSLLLNDGRGRFTYAPLPLMAQSSPIYAIASADVNRDGHPDLLLGGNQATARVSMGKMDANYGLLLLGDGKGQFQAVPQWRSGLSVKGDMKQWLIFPGKSPQVWAVRNQAGVVGFAF